MKLKQNPLNPKPPSHESRSWKRRGLLLAGTIGFLGWTALAFMGGGAFLDFLRPSLQNITGATSPNDAVMAFTGAPARWARAWMADTEVPRLRIDIKYKHLHTLHQKRDEAIGQGLLQTSSADFVPAEIRLGERTIRVKLRLKGDYTDHLEGQKWSMRIHVKKKDQLFGMRRFSLQAPATRAFQAEPIVLDHYRREGVLAPRYFFVNVSINGDDIGLMAVEESFSKELLESQQRRAGVIIRFHEDPFFANEMRNGIHGPFENFYVAKITPFGSSAIAESPELQAEVAVATGMLRAFLDEKLTAAEVFDVELMSRFIAVSEVWGTMHALRWHNLRFYLNPITRQLEPIAFDVNMQATYVGTGMVSLSELFTTRLLDDPIMRKTFVRNLKRIAEEMSEGETTTRVRELEKPLLAILNREFPLRSAMKMDRLERRAIELATTLRETNLDLYRPALVRPDAEYPDAIHAHLERDALGDYVELVNVMPVPVLVHSLVYATPNSDEIHPLDFNAAEQLPIRLPATPLGMPPTPIKIRYRAVTESGPIQGELQISGQQRRHRFEASAYFAALERHPIVQSSLAQTLEAHPYLVLEPSTGRLRMSSGEQRIHGSLVLPAGIGLELGPGTTLRFEDGEALIASGPLTFLGTPDAPVILAGRDEDTRWSGIIVFRSDESHHWKNVIVRNTSGIERPGWRLTGGVTLREAVVLIEDSRFESNHCEDALNLVRTEFELINVHFSDTPSDAFDGDFSNGRVIGGSFSDIGGDGIDVSGADVTIENVLLTRIHDKAFSIGEGSRAKISGVHVDGAGTALASKDASHTEISDALFENIEFTAIMAYVKKPEYGPAKIIANDIVLREVGREVLVQIGSQLTLNGVEIMGEDVDVDSLYKGGYMKK